MKGIIKVGSDDSLIGWYKLWYRACQTVR